MEKTVAIPDGETIGSPEWICLTADPSVLRPRFLHAVLLGRSYRDLAKDLSAGQQHPRFSVDTLRRMRIPLLPLEQQDVLVSQIDLLRAELIGSPGPNDLRTAIDAAFCDQFGLDPEQVRIGPSPRVATTSLVDVAASRDVRFSWPLPRARVPPRTGRTLGCVFRSTCRLPAGRVTARQVRNAGGRLRHRAPGSTT